MQGRMYKIAEMKATASLQGGRRYQISSSWCWPPSDTYALLAANLRLAIVWKSDVIHKTRNTQNIALSSEELATANDNMHQKFGQVRTSGFWDILRAV